MQGLLVTWRPLEWQWSDPDSTEVLMTCDPPPTMTRGSSVTQRDNCLGKCWLISRHADIISQLSWCLYGDFQLFFMFVFCQDEKFMRCRSFWSFDDFDYPLGTVCARGPELKCPQMCIFIFVIFTYWWGLKFIEVGLLTHLSLKQMEKVSFLNPKCPFLHLGKLANTRNSIRKDFSL